MKYRLLSIITGTTLILIDKPTITGNVIGSNQTFSLLQITGTLIILSTLVLTNALSKMERIVRERDEKRPITGTKDTENNILQSLRQYFLGPTGEEYEKLVSRLHLMETSDSTSSQPVYEEVRINGEVNREASLKKYRAAVSNQKTGVSLSELELEIIRSAIVDRMPDELKNSDTTVYVTGSLLPERKGMRGKKVNGEPTKSDEFYYSDVDIAIVGEHAFDYIDDVTDGLAILPTFEEAKNNPEISRAGGKLAGEASYRFTSKNASLNRYEAKRGYRAKTPIWLEDALEEIDQHILAGIEHREVNIKFFKNNVFENNTKRTLYKK